MKFYELTYLISPDLSNEEANFLSAKITSLISEKQGILEKNLSLLKKQLAYPITQASEASAASQGNAKHSPSRKKTAAYLASVSFQIRERQRSVEGETKSPHPKPEGLEEIKKEIESNTKILRYLLLDITKAKLKITAKTIRAPLVTREKRSVEKTPKKKVELKEIEKKLEEILK